MGGWCHSVRLPRSGGPPVEARGGEGWRLEGQGEGYLFEFGCRGIRPTAANGVAVKLVEDLGLMDVVLGGEGKEGDNKVASNRFIYSNGHLQHMSMHPWDLVTSELTRPLILPILGSLFGSGSIPYDDISVHDFITRHLGPHAADILVDGVMGGIYAGDVRFLSAKATLPFLWRMDQSEGSLVRAILKQMWQKLTVKEVSTSQDASTSSGDVLRLSKAVSISFKNGMSTLPRALVTRAEQIGAGAGEGQKCAFLTHCPVSRIDRDAAGKGYIVSCKDDLQSKRLSTHPYAVAGKHGVGADGTATQLRADVVISAVPTAQLERMLPPLSSPFPSLDLSSFSASSVAIGCVAYDDPALVPRALASMYANKRSGPTGGFGYLVPTAERTPGSTAEGVLGMVWDSCVFPEQADGIASAKGGDTRLSVMMGGATAPWIVSESDQQLTYRAIRAVTSHLGLPATPSTIQICRGVGAIPQYTVGHVERVSRLKAAVTSHMGNHFHLLGNAYAGVGIADCIENGLATAATIAATAAAQ
jgi:oxygen-dependent protoporphyrinogen oxidase